MIKRVLLAEALASLSSSKQRSLLALIGIVIGIGSVIAMVSVSGIVKHEAMRQFKEMGTDLLNIQPEHAARVAGAPRQRPASRWTLADLGSLPQAVPAVVEHAPLVNVQGAGVRVTGKPLERVNVLGTSASLPGLAKLRVSEGRFISDLDEASRHVVIGHQLMLSLRKAGVDEALGARLRIGDGLFTVVGVLAASPPNAMTSMDPDHSAVVPLALAWRMSRDPAPSQLLARVGPGVDNNLAMAQVKMHFQALGKAVSVRSPEEIIAQMEKQMRMFTLLAGAIGSISLIVGGIGVMNVMLVSVTERRREIGVRRALGARRGDIQQQFLVESVILSMIGGVFGVVLGTGAAWATAWLAGWQFVLSWQAIALGVGVAGAVGIFFGFYPARQAARLDPIQALRAS